ncbi:unnamed protein product [Amoebophrya sp. A25]|nr:unnamed protein product [Amoebophrya sp. A25]|eukprot:GSA25T00003558001.1
MDAVTKPFRNLFRSVMRGAPLKPSTEVQEVLMQLQIMPKHLNKLYAVFSSLKQAEKDHRTITTASEVATSSLATLVPHRRKWVEKCLERLVEFGGCFEVVTWDEFLYIFLKFNSLSKVELCQTMFYIIVKDVKSWTIHYLTCTQLSEYYSFYDDCPVESFSTSEINFAALPLHRYYIADFVELCHRYSQLINPLIHLQRSLQNALPSISFWNDYDRVESMNRRINLEFFRVKRANIFLRGDPPFKEVGDLLIPDTFGGQRTNLQQWDRRLPHYDAKQGVWPDFTLAKARKAAEDAEKTKMGPGEETVDLGPLPIDHMADPETASMIKQQSVPNLVGLPSLMNPSASTVARMMAGGGMSGVPGMAGAGGMGGGGMGGGPMLDAQGNPAGAMGFVPGAPPLPVNEVPDMLRLGVKPTNYGVNDENVPKIPQSITSAQIRHNIGLTYAGQYSERVGTNVGSIGEVPRWMTQYLNLPAGRRSKVERFAEVDFIRSIRQQKERQDSVMNLLERANEVPLVPRPYEEFALDPNYEKDEDMAP